MFETHLIKKSDTNWNQHLLYCKQTGSTIVAALSDGL